MAGMSTVLRGLLDRFIRNERGATAIEYGMIAVFLSISIAVTVRTGVGPALLKYYENIAAETGKQ